LRSEVVTFFFLNDERRGFCEGKRTQKLQRDASQWRAKIFVTLYMLKSDDYDKIPLEIYSEIYAEAKTKFVELKSQSETITSRSIKIILSIFALSAWAAATFSQIHGYWGIILTTIYCILFIGILCLLIPLFYNRSVPIAGTYPNAIYGDDGQSLIEPQYLSNVEQVFYFQQIGRYQKKMMKVEQENKERGIPLKKATIVAAIMVLYVIFIFSLQKSGVF
jgi:hypothetical protein